MKIRLLPIVIVLIASACSTAFAGDRWLHVFVEEGNGEGDKVRVNLPLSLIEAVVPIIEEKEFTEGKLRIDDEDFTTQDLHKILKAVREAEEGEYVQVEGVDEDVVVSKKGNYMTVRVEEGEDSTVDVRLHMAVLDALLSGGSDELDLLAGIRALGDHEKGDFVVVNDDDEHVRIWIDDKASGM